MIYDSDGNPAVSNDEAEVLREVDKWLSNDNSFEPADDELMDVAAMMAAHDENPWG
jgi:hypothetical protein